MRRKLMMPKLGLTMTEGQISEWSVPVGSPFKQDDVLFIVETEKVATEIPAEGNGILTEITVAAGQTVAVGEVIGYWEDVATESQPAPAEAAAPPEEQAEVVTLAARPVAASVHKERDAVRVPVTPLARRLAVQLGVDLTDVVGSGPNRRIKAADVQAMAKAPPATQPAQQPASLPEAADGLVQPTVIQATMAKRLTAGKRDVPHFYLAVDVRVDKLVRLRRELNVLDSGLRFTYNHFVVAAVGRALKDMPEANRVWEDDGIRCFTDTDVGVAVSTGKGLFVPVLRDAGRISLAEIARRSHALAERARNGRLAAQDMSGGAVTVSNAGMHNVRYMTPIINPGQAMILGVGSINQCFRPDADGKPALCEEMGLVLACDHRMLDGVSGLAFLNRVAAYLEQPMKLLLEA